MKKVTCKLIEYRGKKYLLLNEKMELKRGDRVLIPMPIPVGEILGPAGGWDMDGFYSISNTSAAVSFLGNGLSVIAAIENEIKVEDLMQLKEDTVYSILLKNNKPYFLNGKIVISF
jgi:hypothetical protein